jgi:hypothetical protein
MPWLNCEDGATDTKVSPMSDENQSPIPHSFIELYLPRGRLRPIESRQTIGARYELCEDMANMLVEHARATLFDLNVTEQHVLDRVYRGLLVDGSVVSKDEARWVSFRLAELLGWPPPQITPEAP